MAVAGMLRSSEFLAQDRKHPGIRVPTFSRIRFFPSFEKPRFMTLVLPEEKSLMSRKTDEVVIPATGLPVDPIREIKNMIKLRGVPFATLCSSDAFLFVASERRYQPVDTQQFNRFLDHLCYIVNLPSERYTPHSCRIGGASSLMAAGVQDAVVQILGRWNSSAYRSYIRLDKEILTDYCSNMFKMIR